jgi:hypothetical protein
MAYKVFHDYKFLDIFHTVGPFLSNDHDPNILRSYDARNKLGDIFNLRKNWHNFKSDRKWFGQSIKKRIKILEFCEVLMYGDIGMFSSSLGIF